MVSNPLKLCMNNEIVNRSLFVLWKFNFWPAHPSLKFICTFFDGHLDKSGLRFTDLNFSVLTGCILLGGLFIYDIFWVSLDLFFGNLDLNKLSNWITCGLSRYLVQMLWSQLQNPSKHQSNVSWNAKYETTGFLIRKTFHKRSCKQIFLTCMLQFSINFI